MVRDLRELAGIDEKVPSSSTRDTPIDLEAMTVGSFFTPQAPADFYDVYQVIETEGKRTKEYIESVSYSRRQANDICARLNDKSLTVEEFKRDALAQRGGKSVNELRAANARRNFLISAQPCSARTDLYPPSFPPCSDHYKE